MTTTPVTPCPPAKTTPAAATAPPPARPEPVAFNYTQSDSFAPLLKHLGVSLLVTTYQANKLLVLREQQGGLSILVRSFDRPMGLAADSRRIALGTRDQIWTFRNAPDLASRIDPTIPHDACFLPRSTHVTGDIGVHEMAFASDDLWIVNTRFSCLCTLNPDYSFVPRWRPPFITALAAEDRCHLNGIAIVDHQPRYLTALGNTDTKDGWRAGKSTGGVLLSYPDGNVISSGLCMPHSPRWHQNSLYFLESGTGTLHTVDPHTGHRRTVVTDLPGFARGLAFSGHYAFIGLSKIRPTSAMAGVPIADRRDQLKSGITVVDLRTSQVCATVDFQSAVEEVFDVQLLTGPRFPEILGFQKDTLQHTFVVPQS